MTDVLHNDAPIDADNHQTWVDVCAADAVTPDRGVAALVAGQPVAIFRLAAVSAGEEVSAGEDEWFAVDHIDPRTGAPVIARGLVGSTVVEGVEVPTVASPLHKQRYDLRTGAGIGDEDTSLRSWAVAVFDGRVLVAVPEMSPA